jgi:hypothetical protein
MLPTSNSHTAPDPGYWKYLPYVLGLAALLVYVSFCTPFWRSNDDVSMSLIASGGGIAASPSPRLVLTNIAWGWLIYITPSLGHVHAYTLFTYLALILSYSVLMACFLRNRVDHAFAAVVVLFMFAPTLVFPQFSLVAGDLAVAGLVLLCTSLDKSSLRGGITACALLVLSGLVRADETALVVLAAAPLCFGYIKTGYASPLRRRWLVLAGVTAAVFLGFQVLDYLDFSSGAWSEFGSTYSLRTQFTDFKLARYFVRHPEALAGTGFSANDMALFTNWFYADTQVFTPDRLTVLMQRLPLWERLSINLDFYREALQPLFDTQFHTLLALLLLGLVFHRRRWRLLGSLCVLAGFMFLLLLSGRAQITRIYLPACAALLALAVLEMQVKALVLRLGLAVLALVLCIPSLHQLYLQDVVKGRESARVQAFTCSLPHDRMLIIWGSDYPFPAEYLPFGDSSRICPLHFYSFGEYSLAPYALDHLHQYTGGKDFVPAVLAGQSFEVIAQGRLLQLLKVYFEQHYSVGLRTVEERHGAGFAIFRISLAAPPAVPVLGAPGRS